MKKILSPSLLFCLLLTLFCSCSKDFDSNASYKDVTVVYGVLNADEPVSYIKIYKGYLTSGDAHSAAQEFDSLYYFDKIDVVLEEYVSGTKLNEWRLDTTTQIPRQTGDFTTKQLLYKVENPLRKDASYLLRITNKETGREVTAKTNIVGNFRINQPNAEALNIFNATSNPFGFTVPANGVAYDIYQYFYWIERDKNTHVETEKYIKRRINADYITTSSMQYVPSMLLNAIAANVYEDDNVERYLKMDSCIKFEVWAVNDDLYKYVSTSAITSSVVMDRQVYTNIICDDNLVSGIFASRSCTTSWYKLTRQSQEAIVTGDQTRNLGFHYFEEYH